MRELVLAGFDHRNCGVETLEKIHVTEAGTADFYSKAPFHEKAWLQTCNRRELIALAEGRTDGEIGVFLREMFGQETEPAVFRGREAVLRLFRIAAGLESAVPGEAQVLGQVKAAYLKARELKACGSGLGRVFESALHAGRLARKKTGIGKGAVSMAQAAIALAEAHGGIAGREALIIGAGKVNAGAALYAVKKGASLVLLANRTHETALELAEKTGAKAVRFDSLAGCLLTADIVISATSAPHCVLKKENAGPVLAARKKPLLMIDLAVPRDIDPKLAGGNAELYDVDDVKEWISRSLSGREECIPEAEKIIMKEAEKYEDRFGHKKKPAGNGAGARGNAGTAPGLARASV